MEVGGEGGMEVGGEKSGGGENRVEIERHWVDMIKEWEEKCERERRKRLARGRRANRNGKK